MAYTKTIWNNDTTPAISADNLNNIEDGIETLDQNKITLSDVQDNLVNVGTSVDTSYKVNVLYSNLIHNAIWEQGTISGSTGALNDSTTRIRTQSIKVQPNTKYTIKMNSSYGYGVMGYSSNDVSDFTENMITAFATGTTTFTTGNNTNYIRVVVATGSPNYQTTITTSAVSSLEAVISLGESIITPTINVDGEDIYKQGQNEVYSTSERVIGTWIDGKPLYRKVIDCGALPNNTTKSVASGISNMDKLISMTGVANSSTGGFTLPLISSTNINGQVSLFYTKSSNEVQVSTNYDRSGISSSYVILEYTKTTD